MGGMPSATFDQDAFRGRDDDVTLNSGTWNGGGGLNGNWTQVVNANFRVRFVIQETSGVAEANFSETLFYSHNGGTYTAVGAASSVIQGVLTSQYADGDDTTQLLGSGTFVTPNGGGVEGDGGPGLPNVPDFSGNDETEFEFCLSIVGADVADGDTIDLRVYKQSSPINTYTRTPQITVSKPASHDIGYLAANMRQRLHKNLIIR